MEKHYHFAGIDLVVSIPEKWMYLEDRVLAPFRTEGAQNPHRLTFQVVDELPVPFGELIVSYPAFRIYAEGDTMVRYIGSVEREWKEAYLCAVHHGCEHTVYVLADQIRSELGVNIVLNAMEAEHLVVQKDGFLFHCSYISHGDRAILFTAPSETGKTTQAELWKEYRNAQIINGDRAAVRLDHGVFMADGIPFCGSSRYCENKSLPVEAIVYLAQAPETTVRRINGYEAFMKIWEGVSVNTWNLQDMQRVSAVVQQLAETVPVYHMPCRPDESAVIALEQMLRKQDEV